MAFSFLFMVIVFRLGTDLKALLSMLVMPLPMVTSSRLAIPQNTVVFIVVTLSGIITFLIPSFDTKAEVPIVWTLSGIMTSSLFLSPNDI